MTPDWQTLFASRPLESRAIELPLPLPGEAGQVWFAHARREDLVALPTEMFLAETEAARAKEFKFPQPRENFALGRLAGKLAMLAAVDQVAADVRRLHSTDRENQSLLTSAATEEGFVRRLHALEIANGERGEPVVRTPAGESPALGVSLSHVNGLGAAVAFPTALRVGLDLELLDAKRAETVRKAVPRSAVEEAWLRATPLPEPVALLALWTAREALGKALGCGWACPWPTLALGEIGTIGPGRFLGRFEQHAEFFCTGSIGPDAVMAVAVGPPA